MSAWGAGSYHDETTGTLLCGDLFAATCLTPRTGHTLRRLADLAPTTLTLMHGPSYNGDGAAQLRGLAGAYDERLRIQGETFRPPVQRPGAAKVV